jgi:hypothetical protein
MSRPSRERRYGPPGMIESTYMLRHATPAQCETFERLRVMFKPDAIRFTLVGAAACREYGLPPTDDLDIVVCPIPRR